MNRSVFLALLLALAASSVAKAQAAKAQTIEEKVAIRLAIQRFNGMNFWDGREPAGYRLLFIVTDTITDLPTTVVFAKPVEIEQRPAHIRLRYPRLALVHLSNKVLLGPSSVYEYDCVSKTTRMVQLDGQDQSGPAEKIIDKSNGEWEWRFACDPKSLIPTVNDDTWKAFTQLPNVNYR